MLKFMQQKQGDQVDLDQLEYKAIDFDGKIKQNIENANSMKHIKVVD